MRIEQHVDIAAPADDVWEVVGRGFADIGSWASAIPRSWATPDGGGRVCEVAGRWATDVTEQLTHCDDEARTLAYTAVGRLPGPVASARNTWEVHALEPRRTRVRVSADVDLDRPWRLTAPALGLFLRLVGRRTLRELRHRVQTGSPTGRKQRQLAATTGLFDAEPAAHADGLLRSAMTVNALFSAISGVALLLGGSALEGRLGAPAWVLAAIGAGLAAFVLLILWSQTDVRRLTVGAPIVVAGDAAWVAGAALLLVGYPHALTAQGRTALALVTVAVAVLGATQMVGLWRIRTRPRPASGPWPSARSGG